MPPAGSSTLRPQPPQLARADPESRLGPSLLASIPASILNHIPAAEGIPSDSENLNHALKRIEGSGKMGLPCCRRDPDPAESSARKPLIAEQADMTILLPA